MKNGIYEIYASIAFSQYVLFASGIKKRYASLNRQQTFRN